MPIARDRTPEASVGRRHLRSPPPCCAWFPAPRATLAGRNWITSRRHGVLTSVNARTRLSGAVALALLCAVLAGCGSKPSVQPKQVETSDLQSAVSDPQVRVFYQARN